MLQQLPNLAGDEIIHGYRTCALVSIESFFSKDMILNGCNSSFAKSWVYIEDCLQLNFKYVDYQTLAYSSYMCWISVCATTAQPFLNVRVSISVSSMCSAAITQRLQLH